MEIREVVSAHVDTTDGPLSAEMSGSGTYMYVSIQHTDVKLAMTRKDIDEWCKVLAWGAHMLDRKKPDAKVMEMVNGMARE